MQGLGKESKGGISYRVLDKYRTKGEMVHVVTLEIPLEETRRPFRWFSDRLS
jgi:hypothetical protein